jgi:hypothetical protein
MFIAFGGKAVYNYLRKEGAAELRRVELDDEQGFRRDLMQQLKDTRDNADVAWKEAWKRVRAAEQTAIELRVEIGVLKATMVANDIKYQAQIEGCQSRIAELEIENEELRAVNDGRY